MGLASAKLIKINGKPADKINELILRTKANLKERPDNIQQSSLDYVFFSIEIGRPRSSGWKNLEVAGQEGGGS